MRVTWNDQLKVRFIHPNFICYLLLSTETAAKLWQVTTQLQYIRKSRSRIEARKE